MIAQIRVKKKVLVTGGAGYIGSHTIVELIETGYDVVSIDNFSNGRKDAFARIKRITGVSVKNYATDISDKKKLVQALSKEKGIFAVIHFAAYKSVPESVEKPLAYYENNIGSLVNILEWSRTNGVSKFVFSSSCSVYGVIEKLPLSETATLGVALSPYAATKQMGEKITKDAVTKKMSTLSLRYFNPIGAHASGILGEKLNEAANLVPVITQTAIGARKGPLLVYGDSYVTRDGSCVRDNVHVSDIARAHVLALKKMQKPYDVINLGTGKGTTVFELIQAFESVSGKKLKFKVVPPRAGDIPSVYATNRKAARLLGWKPKYSIRDMLGSAWHWQQKQSA